MALSRKILLVEPDHVARQAFVSILDGHGFEIDTADSAEAGLGKAKTATYAVIVLEDDLRRSSSSDLLRQLRELQPGATPVLIASQRQFVRVMEAVNLHGVQGVLTKPFSRELLVETMRRCLRLYDISYGQHLVVTALQRSYEAAGEHRQVLDETLHLATNWVAQHAAGGEHLEAEALARLQELQAGFGRSGRQVFTHLGDLNDLLQPRAEGSGAASEAAEPEPEPAEATAGKPEDKRRHARVPLSIEVHLETGDAHWIGTSEDISVGGMLTRSGRSVEMGSELEVEFRLPGSDAAVRCRARAAWIRPGKGPAGRGVVPGIVLQFINLSARDADAIDRFVTAWDDDVLEHLEQLAR